MESSTTQRLEAAKERVRAATTVKAKLDEEVNTLTRLVRDGKADLETLQRLHQLADEAVKITSEIVDASASETMLESLATAEKRRSHSTELDHVLELGVQAANELVELFVNTSAVFGKLCGCIERANSLGASIANSSLSGTALDPARRAAISDLNKIPDLNRIAEDRGWVPVVGFGWRHSAQIVPRRYRFQEGDGKQ